MSLVPLPWCTSQSRIITRSSPHASSAYRAATATLLNRQKPIARAGSGVMAGRPVGAEPARRRAVEQQVDHLDRAAGGVQRGLERVAG